MLLQNVSAIFISNLISFIILELLSLKSNYFCSLLDENEISVNNF